MRKSQTNRVVVAMSGGVDSSVAAGLLQQQGYDVIGVTMRLWTVADAAASRHHKRCCSVEDTDDARAAADALGIPHYVLNLEREFAEAVVDRFVEEYSLGRTPNPCLACNDRVKFRPLLERAIALEADYLATGHYARVMRPFPLILSPSKDERSPNGAGFELHRAVDAAKDQSYVLYTLGQRELARTLFPLGEYTKPQVRELARRWGLPNAAKPDSADICFIPSGDYRSFVRERIAARPGKIVDTVGNTLGEHSGVAGYTVGQRRGLPARGGGEPLFVLNVDAATDTVVAGPHEELMAEGLLADELSFVSGQPPRESLSVQTRIRYRSQAVPATLSVLPDGTAGVRFDSPQRAVTPGQAAVFYDGDRVLGGGTIRRALPAGR